MRSRTDRSSLQLVGVIRVVVVVEAVAGVGVEFAGGLSDSDLLWVDDPAVDDELAGLLDRGVASTSAAPRRGRGDRPVSAVGRDTAGGLTARHQLTVRGICALAAYST
jgi:hypothetical protein